MGMTWTPLFDHHPVNGLVTSPSRRATPTSSRWEPGSPTTGQSTTAGAGVYRSADAGKTFTLASLEDTHHTSRIVVHPKNPDIVYVAAMGHLFGPNTERGLFKTINRRCEDLD